MPSHAEAHSSSRALCDSVFAALQSELPDLQSSRAKDTCGFYQRDHNRFAYVYHRRDSAHIRIYFRGDWSAPPVDAAGLLDIQTRPKVAKGWDKEFPFYVNIEDESQVAPAAQVLISFSYPLSGRRRRKQIATAPTPHATDTNKPPPQRVEATTYRILRDTALARDIKALHGYKCQICGHSILLPDGSRYAEAHHIRPLGKPHNGPDVAGNILCLCPNHHTEMDYLVLEISPHNIRSVPEHLADPRYISYHNELRAQNLAKKK